jgi:hypothetical protein
MSSLKRTQMLPRKNPISSMRGGVQSAALDEEGSLLARFRVFAARCLTNSECSATNAFSSEKSSGTSESGTLAALAHNSLMSSSIVRISTILKLLAGRLYGQYKHCCSLGDNAAEAGVHS